LLLYYTYSGQSNLQIKYLGEFVETILAFVSEAQVGSIHEKTEVENLVLLSL
jgi:hypothetical protein